MRQKLYWSKGHFDFTSIPNFNSVGRVIPEIHTFEFFKILTHTHARSSIRTFFLNHFSGRCTPFWVSWHKNLDFFSWNKASFMRKQKEEIKGYSTQCCLNLSKNEKRLSFTNSTFNKKMVLSNLTLGIRN